MKSATGLLGSMDASILPNLDRFLPTFDRSWPAIQLSLVASVSASTDTTGKFLLDATDQQRDLGVERLIAAREHRAVVLKDPGSRLVPFRKARDRLDLVAQGTRD